jgi:hypothetical protein
MSTTTLDIGATVAGLAPQILTALGVIATAGLGLAAIKWGLPYGVSFLKRISK